MVISRRQKSPLARKGLIYLMYFLLSGDVSKILIENYTNIIYSHLQLPGEETTNILPDNSEKYGGAQHDKGGTSNDKVVSVCGRKLAISGNKSLEEFCVFYIGEESLTLTNLMYNLNKCQFYTYNPVNKLGRKESISINRLLMKRYYMIEKAKDARIVGILIGTLGVSNYLDIFNRLKILLKKAGKKAYSFIVGKVNVAKLANFMEIDIFVLVACPENTLLDSSEFYQPVITPYEMEIACNSQRDWTGDYVTDFSQLLEGKYY